MPALVRDALCFAAAATLPGQTPLPNVAAILPSQTPNPSLPTSSNNAALGAQESPMPFLWYSCRVLVALHYTRQTKQRSHASTDPSVYLPKEAQQVHDAKPLRLIAEWGKDLDSVTSKISLTVLM